MTQQLARGLGISPQIIPPTNDTLATVVQTKEAGTLAFQEYFVRHRWQPTVTRLDYVGADTAQITEEAAFALANADYLIICPSNPMLSIEPILRVQGVTEALKKRTAPCVVVSPLIGGKAIKGPTDKLMRELNLEASQLGIARYYEGLADGLVIDDTDRDEGEAVKAIYPHLHLHLTQTLMTTIEERREVATSVLSWMIEEVLL
jgi:LPPG:FO 2-phospho-L-lactate transferase